MRSWKLAAFVLVMSLSLVSCQTPSPTPTVSQDPSPTASPTSTPSPTVGPTSTPQSTSTPQPSSTPAPTATPTPIPALSRADVDRIGYGYLAAYVYTLATGDTDVSVFASRPYPVSYPIREGGTVSFTYATTTYTEFNDAIYILSKTVSDGSGTITTDKPADATFASRWMLHHGDLSIDLADYNGVVKTETFGDIALFMAALGTPISDTTVDGFSQDQAWKSRKLTYDGATYFFLQFDFSSPTKHWILVTARITGADYATEQGVTVGMTEADARKACNTGYFYQMGASDMYDPWSGINVYDPEPFLHYDANVWHLNIGIQGGKVVGFAYVINMDY